MSASTTCSIALEPLARPPSRISASASQVGHQANLHQESARSDVVSVDTNAVQSRNPSRPSSSFSGSVTAPGIALDDSASHAIQPDEPPDATVADAPGTLHRLKEWLKKQEPHAKLFAKGALAFFAMFGVVWTVYTALPSLEMQRWSIHNDFFQACLSLEDPSTRSKICNDTIRAGPTPPTKSAKRGLHLDIPFLDVRSLRTIDLIETAYILSAATCALAIIAGVSLWIPITSWNPFRGRKWPFTPTKTLSFGTAMHVPLSVAEEECKQSRVNEVTSSEEQVAASSGFQMSADDQQQSNFSRRRGPSTDGGGPLESGEGYHQPSDSREQWEFPRGGQEVLAAGMAGSMTMSAMNGFRSTQEQLGSADGRKAITSEEPTKTTRERPSDTSPAPPTAQSSNQPSTTAQRKQSILRQQPAKTTHDRPSDTRPARPAAQSRSQPSTRAGREQGTQKQSVCQQPPDRHPEAPASPVLSAAKSHEQPATRAPEKPRSQVQPTPTTSTIPTKNLPERVAQIVRQQPTPKLPATPIPTEPAKNLAQESTTTSSRDQPARQNATTTVSQSATTTAPEKPTSINRHKPTMYYLTGPSTDALAQSNEREQPRRTFPAKPATLPRENSSTTIINRVQPALNNIRSPAVVGPLQQIYQQQEQINRQREYTPSPRRPASPTRTTIPELPTRTTTTWSTQSSRPDPGWW